MADNQIVISDQAPQTLGVTPKPGEKLWCVVTDNGTNYKISKICIANSDVWSDPVEFAGAVNGGLTIADGDKGDITVSNSGGTWTIDNKAVTFAKLADMATGKLLGRSTATAGSPEVIDIDNSLALAAGTLSTNAKIKAVGALSATGLIKSTGANTASIVTTSATIDNLLAAGDAAAARGAIGLGNAFGLPGYTITLPLALVPQAQRELVLAAATWTDITYVSYDFEGRLKSYLGLTTQSVKWQLLIVATNELNNQDIYLGTEPWWLPEYSRLRGKFECRIYRPNVAGAQYAPFRLIEYWGVGTGAANYLIVDIPIFPAGTGANPFDDYWLVQIRAVQADSTLTPPPRWTVYDVFLLGVIQ